MSLSGDASGAGLYGCILLLAPELGFNLLGLVPGVLFGVWNSSSSSIGVSDCHALEGLTVNGDFGNAVIAFGTAAIAFCKRATALGLFGAAAAIDFAMVTV